MISAVHSCNVVTSAYASSSTTTRASASLMPSPNLASLESCGDAMSELYASMSALSDASLKTEKVSINASQSDQAEQLKKELADLAKETHHDNRAGFWHHVGNVAATIGKVAAVVAGTVAAVASIVVSFGATGPLIFAVVAVALSAASMAVQETHCFGQKASIWVGLGLALGATVCGGLGAASLGASASSTAATMLNNGAKAAQLASAAATATSGGAEIAGTRYDGLAMDDSANALANKNLASNDTRQIQDDLDFVQVLQKSQQQALDSLQGAMQTRDDGGRAAATWRA